MFIKEKLRPYEISLWTLQDSFITVLKAYDIYSKGQIETPKCKIKNDGTQELNFSIPMYYYEDGLWIENPIWYNVINGALIANLRKLKVIFNKGELEEEIFEFVINKVVETHSEGQLKCEVTAEGLAFQELGKVGYKISLMSQDFLNEYQDWYNSTVGIDTDEEKFDYQTKEEKDANEPKNNINYWCDKIFKNSYWTYEIQMDWSVFDGIIVDFSKAVDNEERERNGLRRTDRVYEEEYISSWELEGSELDGILVPTKMENFKEKLRLVDLEKSNIYNLTQNLAETYGVFCKYKYIYDDNYHIVGKKCIFYNNFLAEQEGSIDINYPFGATKIEREIDSTDIVTKMFVTALEDNTSPSGLITIADASANKLREDYILNFDYLHSIGTITDEQYKAIEVYERSMYLKNIELEPIGMQIANLKSDLSEYEAQKTFATEAKIQDKEQMDQAKENKNNVMNKQEFLVKNRETPLRGTLLKGEDGKYYVNITQEGIDYSGKNKYALTKYAYDTGERDENGDPITGEKTIWVRGIRLFYYKKVDESINKILTYYEDDSSNNPDKEDDNDPASIPIYPSSVGLEYTNGNLTRLTNLTLKDDAVSNSIFITCTYSPALHYQNIYEYYAKLYVEHTALEEEAISQIREINNKLERLEEKYKKLLEEKSILIADFENMMGPALKEGSWQAENYTDYGSKYEQQVEIGKLDSNSIVNFDWDSEAFDEEQLLYYPLSGEENNQKYYLAINLSGALSVDKFKEHINDLSFIYDKVVVDEDGNPTETVLSTHQMIIGSKACYAFIQEKTTDENGQEIFNEVPILLLLDKNFDKENKSYQNFRIGTIETTVEEDKVIEKVNNFNITINWVDLSNKTQVYPRIKIDSLLLKTSEDELIIKYKDEALKNYYDYSVLIRQESYFITLKNNLILKDGLIKGKIFDISYSISNAALSLYLDSLEVSKTNSAPQVSYKVEVSGLNKNFIRTAYNNLNRIVNINDFDLKFENVQGYISELDLSLDNPWEDEITVQNYKTKFEDLFSTIVASSEQMKVNSFSYNNAANAFSSSGTLKPSVIQNAITQTDLTYAFQSGNLTIDELNGIWARSDAGVVAMRGGGIFCATEQDSNGNWLWNTGIMPSGINASLLTAGQIDTNLIKIFAGENLRLQLNAEGLFAYKVNDLGEADLNRYIVHNSEGLFSTIIKNNNKVDLVEVSWNGFILRDENNNIKFKADPNGNLFLSGEIQASIGKIGNWEIKPEGLWYKNGTAGLIPDSGIKIEDNQHPLYGHEKMLWVEKTLENGEKNEFVVSSDGTLYCNDIIAKGTISAGSYIGKTEVGEIDEQMRTISVAVLDGTTFSYNNRNYDNNLIISPLELKFRIYTNALSKDELCAPNSSNELEGYNFYYSLDEIEWTQIQKIDSGEYENIIWKPNYLTFILKNDIMFKDLKESEIGPQTTLYFKVEKEGRERIVSATGDISYSGEIYEEEVEGENGKITIIKKEKPFIYSDTIQLVSEKIGIGKFMTPIDPPSYTFIEDQNNEIQYEGETTFSVELIGFDLEKDKEELENSYWSINGIDCGLRVQIEGSDTEDDSADEAGAAVLISDEEEIIINGEKVEEPYYDETLKKMIYTSIDGRSVNPTPGVDISLITQGDRIIASARISNTIVPEGGNIVLSYHIGQASRTANCFKIRNGSDGINIVMRSSSGDTLISGDTETELSTEIYFGQQLMNGEDSETQFYYVWKKDGIALSNINLKTIQEIVNEETSEINYEKQINSISVKLENGLGNEDFFKQKIIYITAADFGIKSNYSCDVFSDRESALKEYLLNNGNQDEELEFEKKE